MGHRRTRRRGSAYVLVLGCAMILAVIGFGSLSVMRVQNRYTTDISDTAEARYFAQSAIDLGRYIIKSDSNWRSRTNGYWFSNQAIGLGRYSLQVTDPLDNNLASGRTDPVLLTGTGSKGRATQHAQIRLDAVEGPLTCLQTGLTVGGSATFNAATVHGVQTISSNATMTASSSSIWTPAQAASTPTGSTYQSGKSSLSASRTLPDSTVFSSYSGRTLDISSFSSSGGNRIMQDGELTPEENPFGGGSDDNGIYVINCQSQNLIIQNMRIVGTLVLVNPGSGSAVQGSVHWVPAVSNYPCLLVNGSIALKYTTAELTESSSQDVNFNEKTPYPFPSGSTNAEYTDSYPSAIHGLIYVSDNVTTMNSPTWGTLVVGGTLTAQGTISVNYDSTFYNDPPPGFTAVTMSLTPGSWKRIVN